MHNAEERMAFSQSFKLGSSMLRLLAQLIQSHGSRSVAASSLTEVSQRLGSVAAFSPTGKPEIHGSVSLVASSHRGERNIAVELPSHLHGVFGASKTQLNAGQDLELAYILCSFSDVLAHSHFDLGWFTAIEHAKDTGDAKLIKQ